MSAESVRTTESARTSAAKATDTKAGTAETSGGRTTVVDGVVAKIAGIAAREVNGVHALGGGAARALGAIRNTLNNTDLTQGIRVEVGEKQVAVDVTIVTDYPVALQQVADDVRSAIRRAMEDLVGMEVAEINVTVDDVHLPSDDDDERQTQQGRSQDARSEARAQEGRVQ